MSTPSDTHDVDFTELADEYEAGSVISDHHDQLDETLRSIVEGETDVTWLQGQSCSGCTVSLLQGEYPVIEETFAAFRSAISFHPTLMDGTGTDALDRMDRSPDLLVLEGSVPTAVPQAATLGHDEDGKPRPILDWVQELAADAEYVVAVGTCSSFGGIPAARASEAPDMGGRGPTGAKGLQYTGQQEGGVFDPDFRTGSGLPVVNVPGCPTHPDHVLLTIATLLNGYEPELDVLNRPLPFFEPNAHANCPLLDEFIDNEMAELPGEEGCLADLGCAGFFVSCDDSARSRNGGTSICRTSGAPCIGCVEPEFWDRFSPFYEEGDDRDVWEGAD